MDIALIGGHGKVALLAQPLLVGAGHAVRAVIRSAEQSGDVEAAGGQPVVADVETLDAAGWDQLLRGSDAVIWSAGAGGGDPRRTWAVDHDAAVASMDAAARMGVRRYLMVSYAGARRDHGVPTDDPFHTYAEAKARADEHLRGSDLAWTVLGPSRLTSQRPTGRIRVGGGADGEVSRANVAAVIAAALADPRTVRRTIDFHDGDVEIAEALAATAR